MSTPRGFRDRSEDGLLTLIGDIPELVRNLVVAEVDAAKRWIGRTAKDGGIGIVWFLAALFVLFWSVPVFGVILIAGFSEWWGWPVWLSALVVFFVLLVLVVVAALFGVLRMRRLAARRNPVDAVKENVAMVKDVTDEF